MQYLVWRRDAFIYLLSRTDAGQEYLDNAWRMEQTQPDRAALREKFGAIKGLTVEIGGDTTKLGKALESVEKKSRSLSTELGQINKLLKMDPGNADLLAQKQKVLADAVAQTAKKLETLKDAERQVQAQFERGEASEEQVRALQREIIATTKKMDSYERAARETAEAVERLGSSDAEDDIRETGAEAKDAAKKVDDFGDAAKNAEKSSGNLGGVLAGAVKTGLAAVGAIAAAAVTGLVAAAESTREYRTEMGKLDTAFTQNGFSAEAARSAYTGLVGILGETDQSVEAANHLAKLTDNEKDLATWTGDILPGVFATFGDSLPIEGLTEAANETAKVGQVTGPLADALNWAGVSEDAFNESLAKCTSEQERQALITETLAGLYGKASDAYKETNAEVIRANQANDAWMQSMAGIGGAIEPIITDIKMMGASLLADAVPGVQALAEAFRGLINGEDGAAADFAAAVSGLVTGLVTKLTEALPTIAQTGLSIITTLVTSLVQQLPTLLSTGGQIIGQLLSGIASSLPDIAQGALKAIGGFVDGLQKNLPKVLDKGREILVNLSKGIATSLPDLVSQGLDIIMKFATTIYDNAPKLINTGFDVLSNLISGIVKSLPTLIAKAPEIISKFANTINDNVPLILKRGVDLVVQLVKGIVSAIPTLIANIPKIVTAIVDVIQAFNWLQLGKNVITFLKNGITSMVNAVKGAGTNVLNSITNALKSLPSKLLNLGKTALTNLKNAIISARSAVASAGGNILTAIVNAIKNLPSKLLSLGKDAISKLGSAISSGAGTIKSKAVSIFNSIIDAAKSIPSKMVSIGKNIIGGVIDGIGSMVSSLYNSIKNALSGLVSKAKQALGINSPSKVFAQEVGRGIPEGVAVGTEQYTGVAEKAVTGMTDDVLAAANKELAGTSLAAPSAFNGLEVERSLQQRATATRAAVATSSGIVAKLDKILEAIERGQILTIDSKQLIGATADGYDSKLGQLRRLAELGAV